MAVLPELFDDINCLIDDNLDQIKKVLIVGDLVFNTHQFPPEPQFRGLYVDFMRSKYPEIAFDVLDFNGHPGVLNLNLNYDIEGYDDTYELIVDGGTCEHVDNQVSYFYNMNKFLKKSGYYYSNCIDYRKSVDLGEWLGHCFYYYSFEFFESLKEILGWDIIDFGFPRDKDSTNSLIFTLLQKNHNVNVNKNNLKKIYDLIDVVIEETEITRNNGSNLNYVKELLGTYKNEN